MLRELALPEAKARGVTFLSFPSCQISPFRIYIMRELSSGRPGLRRDFLALAPVFVGLLGVRGFQVDAAGQLSQFLICFFFFLEGLLQERQCPVFSEELGVRADTSVTRHFIVLDALSGGNKSGVQFFRSRIFCDHFGAFLDKPCHAPAFFAARGLSKSLQDLSRRTTCSLVCSRCSSNPARRSSEVEAFAI